MNIFFLDKDPTLAAQAQCDKHVVKMILESAQLLCTTHHVTRLGEPGEVGLPNKFYKPTHKNHPSSKWIREHNSNYDWLVLHAISLCDEYTYRYRKIHKSEEVIRWCFDNRCFIRSWRYQNKMFYPINDYQITKDFWITKPALAMPDEYKCDDPVESYRRYYTECKRNTIRMTWTKRNPPEWWNNEDSNTRNI